MTTYQEALDNARKEESVGNPNEWPTCVLCHHIGFYFSADRAHDEGHVYSTAGLSEWRITLTCEFCFDRVTADPSLTEEEQEAERLAGIEAYERAEFNEAMRGLEGF